MHSFIVGCGGFLLIFIGLGTVLGILLIHSSNIDGQWWNSEWDGPGPALREHQRAVVAWEVFTESPGETCLIRRDLQCTGCGKWPWAEKKSCFHFNYSFNAGEMGCIIFTIFGNATVYFSSSFHIPWDIGILAITCKIFKNKGYSVVSGGTKPMKMFKFD